MLLTQSPEKGRHLLDAAAQSAAHESAMRTALSEIAAALQERLGQKNVAWLAGADYSKTVGRWASGDSKPRSDAEDRLRFAYQLVQLLQANESDDTVRAWFVGLNPSLKDESPVNAIRKGQHREVLEALKVFIASRSN